MTGESSAVVVPFPLSKLKLDQEPTNNTESATNQMYTKWARHPAIIKLSRVIDLERNCGYITMINIKGSVSSTVASLGSTQGEEKFGKLSKVNEEDGGAEDSDFQVVEPSTSVYSEPKNGFNDEQCAKIYQEELEDQVCTSSNYTLKPAKYDARKQKLESLRLDLSAAGNKKSSSENIKINTVPEDSKIQDAWFDDWVLLDCHFGLPLFDSNVNEIVSQRMQSNDLWAEKK